MALDREAIFAALFALTQNVTFGPSSSPIVTRSRVIELPSEVSASQQPWLGQAEHTELVGQATGLPYRHVLHADWIAYHRAGDAPGAIPTQTNNWILQALEKALEPTVYDPGFVERRNTLQGLVHHCFIEGTVIRDPGDMDKQGLLIVPIKLLVP